MSTRRITKRSAVYAKRGKRKGALGAATRPGWEERTEAMAQPPRYPLSGSTSAQTAARRRNWALFQISGAISNLSLVLASSGFSPFQLECIHRAVILLQGVRERGRDAT